MPGASMKHRRYDVTKEDLERMRDARISVDAIAKFYGCHHTTVMHWLDRYGLDPVLRPEYRRKDQVEQFIARAAH